MPPMNSKLLVSVFTAGIFLSSAVMVATLAAQEPPKEDVGPKANPPLVEIDPNIGPIGGATVAEWKLNWHIDGNSPTPGGSCVDGSGRSMNKFLLRGNLAYFKGVDVDPNKTERDIRNLDIYLRQDPNSPIHKLSIKRSGNRIIWNCKKKDCAAKDPNYSTDLPAEAQDDFLFWIATDPNGDIFFPSKVKYEGN